ncbi:ABC transporter permease [Devosia nitrariae]|uniref:ABC transporter permease n=1 Tax=Devosia nitrariae TaxID=2071872 RepID=A0ABQ5W5D3_9HYPH|nr:ABC transporter permease [Devosia nitrariae]GLQ54968.1 ABC transporter permease [Devosia nitrariae]
MNEAARKQLKPTEWNVAFHDLASGFRQWRLWTALGYEDLRHAYRRTLLGLVWIGVSFGTFALVKILIFSGLNDQSTQLFSTWVVAGFLSWQFISATITSGANVFIASEGWIKGVRLPMSTYVYQNIFKIGLQDLISLVVAIALIVLFGYYNPIGILLSLVAIPMYVLTAVPVQLLLGMLCVFSRDLQQFINTGIRLLFFATPIIWMPAPNTVLAQVSYYNPFSYFLSLFRTPILEGVIPLDAILVWFFTTLTLWGVALFVFKSYRSQLAHWL